MKKLIILAFLFLTMFACSLSLAEENILNKDEILQDYYEWNMDQDGIVIENSIEIVKTVFEMRVEMAMESGKTKAEAEKEILNFYLEKMTEGQVQNTLVESASDTPVVENVEVPVGEYVVGIDIPAGTYTLTTEAAFMSEIHVNDGEQYYGITSNDKVGKIVLNEGDTVKIQFGSMFFSTYVGLNWN